jgi:RNase P/RNase MRP subunit POP5
MKEKRRYILAKSSKPVTGDALPAFESSLYHELLKMLGELNYADANPKIIKMMDNGLFILRTNMEGTGACIRALAMIKKLNGEDAFFYTLKTSGTILALSKPRRGDAAAVSVGV